MEAEAEEETEKEGEKERGEATLTKSADIPSRPSLKRRCAFPADTGAEQMPEVTSGRVSFADEQREEEEEVVVEEVVVEVAAFQREVKKEATTP